MNTQLLEIQSMKIYADLDPAVTIESGGDLYLEIKYIDLNGLNQTLTYHSTKNGLTGTGSEVDNLMSMFMTVIYYAFDKCDMRNEFHDALYKMNFQLYKRGYNKYVLVDKASELTIQVQTGTDENGDPVYEDVTFKNLTINIMIDEFVQHLYMNTKTPDIVMQRKDAEDLFKILEDGSKEPIPFEYCKVIKNYKFRNLKLIWDTAYDFSNNRMLDNGINNYLYGMQTRNASIFIPIANVTDDTLTSSINTIADANPDINFHVALMDPYTTFTGDILTAVLTLKERNNIRLYGAIQVDADWSLNNISTVTDEIDDWYMQFKTTNQSNFLDGIILQNIPYAPDRLENPSEYHSYQVYYGDIRKHAHRETTIDGIDYVYRLNTIGRMANLVGDTDVRQYSEFDAPADMIWGYDSTPPATITQIGDVAFKNKRIITIRSGGALTGDDIESIMYTSGTLYITDADNFESISTLLTDDPSVFIETVRERNFRMPFNDVQKTTFIPKKELESEQVTDQVTELTKRGFAIVDDGNGNLVLTKI